jgi:hypothetical protein
MLIKKEVLEERISSLEDLIVKYDVALLFLTNNPTASYSLDTGQDVVRYTRQDVDSMRIRRDSALTSLANWQNRLSGGNAVVMIPDYLIDGG